MSGVQDLGLGEVGLEAETALREILTRSVSGGQVADYVTEQPLPWDVLRKGGWDLLGAPEADGGGGATLRDLVQVARVWGWTIAPSPLIPTLMTKRWSAAAREHDGPVTVSLPTRASAGKGVSTFGAEDGVRVLIDSAGDGSLEALTESQPDDYAPSLRLVESDRRSALTPEQARELAVVWAAEASGCAARMLSDAVAYAKEREQFGQPIGRFQAIKHHLANAHLMNEQAETAAIVASLDPERAAAASRFAFDAALRVSEISVQVHGGLGFTWEMGLHMYLRHVSALRELAGGSTT